MISCNEEILKAENAKLKEKIKYLEAVLNKIPAFIHINQIDRIDDVNTIHNIWYNKQALDYTQEEMCRDGRDYLNSIHPIDLELAEQSIDYLKNTPQGKVFTGISRFKTETGDCKWINVRTAIFKCKTDGTPWQLISVGFELSEQIHSNEQLTDVLKEINRLKNRLIINKISKREREILKLVTKGLTDHEIADTLFISERTAQTHRNKLIKKTGNKNTASLVTFAVENGLH